MEFLKKLKLFYAEIELATKQLTDIHANRLQCRRGCANCCVDEVTVWNIEAENIRHTNQAFLLAEKPNENGGCAFLDQNGACRIYESRPYVCRTQGLPLRWFDDVDQEIYEFRDICPLNETDEPIEEIEADKCWTIGEPETQLAALQNEFESGKMRRIGLRELFKKAE